LAAPNAAIGAASADITKQEERYQSDETTYLNNLSGLGCTIDPNNFSAYSTCTSQHEQAAQTAQADQNAALAAQHSDVASEITSDQQIAGAISTYVAQLDSITWPSAAVSVAANLTQDLSYLRDAHSQSATDLADGSSVTQDNDNITTYSSEVTTQAINLATALGIPAPSNTAS
jgi:hypothetical protein